MEAVAPMFVSAIVFLILYVALGNYDQKFKDMEKRIEELEEISGDRLQK